LLSPIASHLRPTRFPYTTLFRSVSALMYILVEGGVGIAWLSRQMAILFAIVLASFALFFLYEKRVQEPIMPASIWEYRLIKIAKDRKSTRLNSSTLRSRMPSSAC